MIIHGDMRDVLAQLRDAGAQFDSVVCDPPYHLTSVVRRFGAEGAAPAQYGKDGLFARASKGFMGQTWDGGDIAADPATWRAVFDVMKPGAHLVAFSHTRTYHRMAVAIEEAGFEIRDCLMWLYGSGFPKSHNVALGIDKAAGEADRGRAIPTASTHLPGGKYAAEKLTSNPVEAYEARTAAAAPWVGWGTSLKPAYEPIVLARKPLEGTVAANTLAYGVGGLNIDATRIATTENLNGGAYSGGTRAGWGSATGSLGDGAARLDPSAFKQPLGRWPANVVHDGSEEVEAAFSAFGERGASAPVQGSEESPASRGRVTGVRARVPGVFHADSGSASRFFYCSKASTQDRVFYCRVCMGAFPAAELRQHGHDLEGSDHITSHPTVKPISLMRWLVRMVTPPGGQVLDPFAGTGTTLQAAAEEGMDSVGVEQDAEYAAMCQSRLDRVRRSAA